MITTPLSEDAARTSPEYVRISMAAAIELGLKPGRMFRGSSCGCINLLQNYPEGCFANCSYCGLARERPGLAEDNTFIRVAWPLLPMDLVTEKIAEKEAASSVGRVCVSQVHARRSYDDLVDMIGRVHRAAPAVPISALVSATTLDEERLGCIQGAGADIIGVGLDAATPELFHETRGRGVTGPHTWDQHFEIVRLARRMYGPWNVNCHIIVGLGESDRDLVELFEMLQAEQIAAYLFSFNSEPGTVLQDRPRAPISRLRRVQLVKRLLETGQVDGGRISYDDQGMIREIAAASGPVQEAIQSGVPFMTDGCPDRAGNVACNRPFGSYRPGEEFRDYPFPPDTRDLDVIRSEMQLDEVWGGGE